MRILYFILRSPYYMPNHSLLYRIQSFLIYHEDRCNSSSKKKTVDNKIFLFFSLRQCFNNTKFVKCAPHSMAKMMWVLELTEYQNIKRILYWMWAIFSLLLVHYITIKTAHKAFCIRWMCTSITYSQIASFEAHNILLLHLLKLINWNRRQKKKHAHTRTKIQIILSCCTSNGNNKFQPIDTNDVICLQYISIQLAWLGMAWLGLASLIIINLFGPLNSCSFLCLIRLVYSMTPICIHQRC